MNPWLDAWLTGVVMGLIIQAACWIAYHAIKRK